MFLARLVFQFLVKSSFRFEFLDHSKALGFLKDLVLLIKTDEHHTFILPIMMIEIVTCSFSVGTLTLQLNRLLDACRSNPIACAISLAVLFKTSARSCLF